MTIQNCLNVPLAAPSSPTPSQIGRRSLLCALAALPVASAVPAVATAPAASAANPVALLMVGPGDPTFAAIGRHKQAFEKYLAAIDAQKVIEDEVGFDDDDPRLIAALAATREASNRFDQGAYEFLTFEPKTITGVIALLAYYAENTVLNKQYFPDNDRPLSEGREGAIPFGIAMARMVCRTITRLGARAMLAESMVQA